jgi:hypothetical protein
MALNLLQRIERRRAYLQKYVPKPVVRPHIKKEKERAKQQALLEKYQRDPVGYARDILKVEWWSKQIEIAEAITNHRKVFVKASHSVGKTMLAGGLVNWHFDCFAPSKTLTTAPTDRQVVRLTWGEVRNQRKLPGLLPKAPFIEGFTKEGALDPQHYAEGYTARDANAFQGAHEENLFVIFEEAVGISEEFWEGADGMLSSGEDNRWLAIMNPTDTSSKAYDEDLSGDWHVITISALDHPNLIAELNGQRKPFPKAVSLAWVEEKFKKWCTPIEAQDKKVTDVCWPPLAHCIEKGIEPQWYRPGSLFEGKVLGRWPTQSVDSVWSEAAWMAAVEYKPQLHEASLHYPIEIGCDRARFGDDFTSIFVRRGAVVLHAETHNGWETARTLSALKDLAKKWAQVCGVEPKRLLVKVDDFQGGVCDAAQADGWNFQIINSANVAVDEEGYPNKRSELWFATADRADEGKIDLSLLGDEMKADLRRQVMAPKWKPDSKGRRVVEAKDVTKKRIKRSPDDADALNIAFAPVIGNPLAGLTPLIGLGISGWQPKM